MGSQDLFLLFSDVDRVGHKLQGYPNSFPDADDAKIQKLQILSDITEEVETRAGVEIRAQAKEIRAMGIVKWSLQVSGIA